MKQLKGIASFILLIAGSILLYHSLVSGEICNRVVAIVNDDNRPLGNYRVIGTHSSGIQIESRPSDGDWTVNSGAMHYKGGNVKYEAPNSPTGVWTLQLIDSANTPVGPPVEFSFDAVNPTWYFIIYERQD